MTTKQVCEYLGISHDTLRRREKQGRISPLPRRNLALYNEVKRYDRADVERLKAPAAPRDGQGEG